MSWCRVAGRLAPFSVNRANSVCYPTFSKCQKNASYSSASNTLAESPLYNALADTYLIRTCQDCFLDLHDSTGLPWWGTIVTATVIARTVVTLPLATYQHYIFSKIENLNLELKDVAKELARETKLAQHKFNLTEKQSSQLFKLSIKKQWRKMIIRENCHPFKGAILVIFQIPLWISFSFAIRNLVYMLPKSAAETAQITFDELSVGGFGWVTNLTETDSTFILPIILGITNLVIIELQMMSKIQEPNKFQRYLTNFLRGVSVLLIPVSATVPSCLCLYWVTSSIYGLGQNMFLLSPRVRRFLKIPISPSEIKNPYTNLKTKITHKLFDTWKTK